MPSPTYLTLKEVITRYRGQVSEGMLRNWRAMRIGASLSRSARPSYPASELDRWDKFNLAVCRPPIFIAGGICFGG